MAGLCSVFRVLPLAVVEMSLRHAMVAELPIRNHSMIPSKL